MGAIERITAAATRIITRKSGGASSAKGLQTIAWELYETVPEVGTYADWIANAMSGARLFAGTRQPDGTVEPLPDNSRAAQLVQAIAGGLDGQSELLSDAGVNLAVAGEAWIVIVPDPDADDFSGDRWHVLSTDEVKPQRGKIKAMVYGEEIEIPEFDPDAPQEADAPIAIRVWKSSPRKRWDATSPVIRSIVVLEELRLLNAAVAAVARSRITGRGVLLIPAGTRFPVSPGQDQAEDSLLDTFIEVASTAIREPESAAGTVPIVLEVPGDLIQGVKWLQFTSDFDSLALELRNEAIRRFATGADVPAEVLLGLGDSNHWSAWALTAEALKMGAEPRLGLLCHALTDEWLRPLLEAENDPGADETLIWYDTSALRSSSNKGASALEAFKQGLISDEAARRELGFTEADAPGGEQPAVEPAAPAREESLPVDETQTTPGTEPGQDTVVAASATLAPALTAAVDGVVWAALTVAGQKITLVSALCPRSERLTARTLVASASVHTRYPVGRLEGVDAWHLLDDAWIRVPDIADRYGVDGEALAAALHDYATTLLVSGEPHTFENTGRLLAQHGFLPSTLLSMVAT